MDFIKGNEQVRIDPSGIDISGVGNIIIDSNSITGDISFNNKVNFNGDVSMNGKVSISDNLDVTGDASMNGIIDISGILDICGNVKFDDTIPLIRKDATWFGHDLRGDININGGGWHLVKHKPEGSVMTNNTGYDFTDNMGTFEDNINSNVEFARNINDIVGLSNPNQILIYITGSLGLHWYVIDYNELKNHANWPSSGQGSGTEYSDTALLFSNGEKIRIHQLNPFSTHGIHLYISNNSGQPNWVDDEILRSAPSDPASDRRSYTNISIFARNSTNFKIPTPYPTLIKKELDHLHITAPLNIYPGNNKLSRLLGFDGNIDLQYDSYVSESGTIDNAGGWYLARRYRNFPNLDDFSDRFDFTFSYGTPMSAPASDGTLFCRNVSDYDYDEVLFYSDLHDVWQIWDRTELESVKHISADGGRVGKYVKKSSVSNTSHTVMIINSVGSYIRPHIYYSPVSGDRDAAWINANVNHSWTNYSGTSTQINSAVSYYVRRSDGQPVRLKNKVKVDVDGNLDVAGIITCSRIAASTTDTTTTGFTVTSEGFVGIGTNSPDAPLHVETSAHGIANGTTVYSYLRPDVGDRIGGPSSNWASSNDARISIYSKYNVWAENGYVMSSDSRIKTDISNIDDDRALQMVNVLESKEYHYIDPERRRPTKTIGFIAQEVKEVIPNAVSLQKEWIPDEMRIITEPQWEGSTLTIPDLDMSGNFTSKAKFYVSNDPSGNDEVCKEVEIKEVPTKDSTPLFPKTKFVAEFDQRWNNVFFYGKEVTDFHTINKNQIFALHHSAIQELSRKNDSLQEEVSAKTAKITSLETRLEALETALLAMQSLVECLH